MAKRLRSEERSAKKSEEKSKKKKSNETAKTKPAKAMAIRKDTASRNRNRAKETTEMSSEATPSKGSASAAPAGAGDRPAAQIRYLDRADMAETFADSITGLIFDGQTLRIEFGVTRFDELKPNAPIAGRRYPACRLVLPPAAAVDLINRMQQIAAALTQAGVVRQAPRPGGEAAKA
jgi:hypothetical protein